MCSLRSYGDPESAFLDCNLVRPRDLHSQVTLNHCGIWVAADMEVAGGHLETCPVFFWQFLITSYRPLSWSRSNNPWNNVSKVRLSCWVFHLQLSEILRKSMNILLRNAGRKSHKMFFQLMGMEREGCERELWKLVIHARSRRLDIFTYWMPDFFRWQMPYRPMMVCLHLPY